MIKALQFKEVATSILKADKPHGIPHFYGWDGKPLRVSPTEYQSRMQGALEAMLNESMDVLLVVRPEDIYYLTGFYTIGDSAPQALIISKDCDPFMVARLIEADLVPKLTWVEQVWSTPDKENIFDTFCHAVGAVLPEEGTVGIQLDVITALHHQRLCDFFKRHQGIVLEDASRTVETVRLQKSEYEISCIQQTAHMSELGIEAALKLIEPGCLLSKLHTTIYTTMLEAGSEVPSYMPIVRTTDPSGHGSWMPGERVTEGGLVFVEASACIHGHHSPLMRTAYVLGPEESKPPAWVQEAEGLIQKVFDTCLPLMVPGARACDIDAVGRKIMLSNSCGLKMSARLAYTTGGTAINPAGYAGWGDADFSLVGHNKQELRAGMVFHFIPWFQKYDSPSGPIGLSDAVMVTASGGQRFGSLPLKITVVRPVNHATLEVAALGNTMLPCGKGKGGIAEDTSDGESTQAPSPDASRMSPAGSPTMSPSSYIARALPVFVKEELELGIDSIQ